MRLERELSQDIAHGVAATASLGTVITGVLTALGVATGGVATLIGGAFAAAFQAKAAEIRIVDRGNGVHWPVTWPQMAAVVASVPLGPGGIIAAILLFIHPFAN